MKGLFTAFFLVMGFSLILRSEPIASAKIKQETTIFVGSRRIILPATAVVQVLSINGDKATINYTTADGSPLITQVEVAILEVQPAKSTPLSLSTQSSSSSLASAPSTNTTPTVAIAPASPPDAATLEKTRAPQNRTLEEALALAGDNRPELQKFLNSHPSPEAQLLIQKANQSDLVHLTAQLLSDNLDSVGKAKANAKWAGHVPPEIWQEFVLPYRIADEPLDDFKPEFFNRVSSVVSAANESGDAALLVHDWYWKGNDGAPWVNFKVSESRDQPPRMLLNQTKIGRCFEMNLLCVALLRSVGVPARIAGTSYWMNDEYYHYWVEYYDTKTSTWLYYEGANPDIGTMMAKSFLRKGTRLYPTVYALPGFCPITDPIGKERWDVLINTTALYLPCGTIHFEAAADAGRSPPVFTAYSWNLGAWRSVAQVTGDSQGLADITISANDNNYPYLVSTAVGGQIYWQTATVLANNATPITAMTVVMHPAEKVMSLAVQSAKGKTTGTTEQ